MWCGWSSLPWSTSSAVNRQRRRNEMAAEPQKEHVPGTLAMPAPTAWPFVTALGITLLGAGLVTHPAVSVVGLVLALRGAVGWFREVLPTEQHETVRVRPTELRATPIKVSHRTVVDLMAGVAGHRARVPAAT